MNSTPLIVQRIEIPTSALPDWDQFPPERQSELIQALAALFLPLLQELEKEYSHEQRQ